MSHDYTKFWDDKPVLKMMAESNPAFAIMGPIVEHLRVNYWTKMRMVAESDTSLRKTMPGLLVAPDKMAVYLGNAHFAIEYFGPSQVPDKLLEHAIKVSFFDCRGESDFISSIIGMKFEGTGLKLSLATTDLFYNMFIPTSADATALMMQNGWDMTAENMAFAVNIGGLSLPEDRVARMVNCFFYSEENERLRTRRIQWMDVLPLSIQDTDNQTLDVEVFWPAFDYMVEHDAQLQFPRPALFENERLALLNRFRELILSPDITEPEITAWLAKPAHQFVLKMALPAVQLLTQRECSWIGDPTRPAIIPDFFAVRANGVADIVEFKLPELKGTAVVGKINRETFSAEVASYVAQTHFYKEYFAETINRNHVKQTHGVEVLHPKRILIMGRRWQFENKIWHSIASAFPDLTILTYDDVLDSVASQLFQNPS